MAFAQGKESANGAGVSFKKFVGAASMKVLAVNPTTEEWNKLMGGQSTEERSYIGEKDGVKYAKVTFVVEIDPERSLDKSTGVLPLTFWLRRQAIKGKTSGKIKIIDKYGRTAWATEEDIEAKRVPEYSNGPADIDADYRKCVAGEEELTMFLKTLMCIPSPRFYNRTTQAWEVYSNLKECEARLDKTMKFFDGDFSEVKGILKSFPNNKLRVLLGVKKDGDKEYQDFLTTMFLTNGNPSNLSFQKELKNALSIGRYANTYFGEKDKAGDVLIMDVREYKVDSTEYHDNTGTAIPPIAANDAANHSGGDEGNGDLPF